MDDLISRQAALDAMETWDKFGCDPDGKLVRYDDDKHYIPYVHYEDMVHAIKHLPSAQPETHEERTETHSCDCIERQAAIDCVTTGAKPMTIRGRIAELPAVQTEVPKCKDCYWWTKQSDSLQGRCDRYGFYPTGYWYCAAARERRTDE